MDFLLNGRKVRTNGFPAHATLLAYLRETGLTGAKEGCAEGECGACAVLWVAPDGTGSRYRPVNSCLVLLHSLAGQEIYTVEGLARGGELSAPQRAIAESGGSQCGYCTPGFAVSLFAEYYRPDRKGPCDPMAMAGNLCRCTGYRPLRDAALSLCESPTDPFRARLDAAAPIIDTFSAKCPDARFERPASLAGCIDLLAKHPEARLIAGATDVVVEMNLLGRRWPVLVSIEGIPELREFREEYQEIEIGAGLTLAEVGDQWTSMPAVVREWLELFASPLIRNRATLGGNLATASPVGDSAPLLLALDAELRLVGQEGVRTLPLREFFSGYRQTALRPAELILSVRVPKPLPSRLAFYKVAKRVMDDISTVAAAFAVWRDGAGRVARARAAYAGVARTPVLVEGFGRALAGHTWDAAVLRDAQAAVGRALAPITDHRGSGAYRLAVAQALIEKFWWGTHEAEAA